MAAYSSAGRVSLVIWAATVDPADVPMMRSASVTSTPASDSPAMRPSSHALPAAPPPASTRARSVVLVRGGGEGVVSMGIARSSAGDQRGEQLAVLEEVAVAEEVTGHPFVGGGS